MSEDIILEIAINPAQSERSGFYRNGHSALCMRCGSDEFVFDFGPYGNRWGLFDTQGEGMLNVWHSRERYLRRLQRLNLETSIFTLEVDSEAANRIVRFFNSLLHSGEVRLRRPYLSRYRLSSDFDALNCNCTTLVVDALYAIDPTINTSMSDFIAGRGLSFGVRTFIDSMGWPNRLFVPMDLKAYLKYTCSLINSDLIVKQHLERDS